MSYALRLEIITQQQSVIDTIAALIDPPETAGVNPDDYFFTTHSESGYPLALIADIQYNTLADRGAAYLRVFSPNVFLSDLEEDSSIKLSINNNDIGTAGIWDAFFEKKVDEMVVSMPSPVAPEIHASNTGFAMELPDGSVTHLGNWTNPTMLSALSDIQANIAIQAARNAL